nr:hypothetical protein [Iodidimonas gelatinilytica]
MMAQMIFDEAGNEIIAVIIARLDAQGQRLSGFLAGRFKQVRL